MIMRYEYLSRHPKIFQSCTGLTLKEFVDLAQDLLPRLQLARTKRLSRPKRVRQEGGGAKAQLSLTDQLLVGVVWLRLYPTNEVLGYLFGISDSTVSRLISRVLPVLEASGRTTFKLPDPGKGQRVGLDQIVAVIPELGLLVDSFEQKVQRPKTDQEAYYSGKKKCHTLKSQIVICAKTGRIVDVSNSVAGPTADIKLLEQSALMQRLPDGLSVGGDLGYLGLGALHPQGLGYTPRRKPKGQERPVLDQSYNTTFAKKRIQVEHRIGEIRTYRSITQVDRHHRLNHTTRTVAIAGIINRRRDYRQVYRAA